MVSASGIASGWTLASSDTRDYCPQDRVATTRGALAEFLLNSRVGKAQVTGPTPGLVAAHA